MPTSPRSTPAPGAPRRAAEQVGTADPLSILEGDAEDRGDTAVERRQCPRGRADRARRGPRRAPPSRAEQPPARGRAPRRRTAAGDCRGRLGQDPGADPPHRLPAGDRRRPAGRDPRDHLHQQGGERDARTGRAAGRALGTGDVGDDLPLGLRPDAARRGRAARLFAWLLDLRRVGLAANAEAVPRGAGRRPEALPTASGPLEDLRREEPADRRCRLRRNAEWPLRGSRRRGFPALREADAGSKRDGLRRPPRSRGQRDGAVRGGPRPLAPHLSPRPRRRVPGHQPRPVPAASAACLRARQSDGRRRRGPVGLRVPSRGYPQHPRLRARLPRCCGGQAGAELPLHPDDPLRRQRGGRAQSRASAQAALDRERRRRAGAARGAGRRARGGALGGGRDRAPRRGGGGGALRGRGLLPHQRDESGAGGHAGALRASPTR